MPIIHIVVIGVIDYTHNFIGVHHSMHSTGLVVVVIEATNMATIGYILIDCIGWPTIVDWMMSSHRMGSIRTVLKPVIP